MYQNSNGYYDNNDSNNNGYYGSYAAQPAMSMSQYMGRTFGWMFAGLLLTFAVSMATLFSGAFVLLYNTGLVFLLSIAELVLVAVLSARVQKLQPATATALFFGYAALNGINLSVYAVVYDLTTLLIAFLVGAIYFGVMALYGKNTSRDLSGWGPLLSGALISLLVVTLLGTLLSFFGVVRFGMVDLLISGIGLLVFMGFTAYDTQKLYSYYNYFSNDDAMLEKSSILGALSLYLDYINILLYIIRIMGRNRRRS